MRPVIFRLASVLALSMLSGMSMGQETAGESGPDDLDALLEASGDAAAQDSGPAAPTAPQTASPEVIETIPLKPSPVPVPAAAADRPGRHNRLLEEIVVTAQKREENLQDVPISVQAFSAETLDAKGITNAVDLQMATPGLSYTVLQSFSIIYLRGVGTDAFLPSADLSVATYVDGIYFPFSAGLAQDFGAVERVEVLKGPQGTLFGRNSTGGAISTTTKKPGFEHETSIQTSLGNDRDLRTRVYTNVPLGDELAFNLSALYNRKDSYYEHLDRDLEQDIDKGARLKLRWMPDERFDITLAGLVTKTDGSTGSQSTQIDPKPALTPFLAAAPRPYPLPDWKTDIDTPAVLDFDNQVAYFDARWSPAWLDIRWLGSMQSIETLAFNDYDATSQPIVSYDTRGLFADIMTSELQFISSDSSWGSDWLKYIGGLYYIHSKAGFDPAALKLGFYGASALPGAVAPLAPAIDQLLGLAGAAAPTPAAPVTLLARGLLETTATAGFFQATADLTDWAALTLGGRYQIEERFLYEASVGMEGSDSPLVSYPQQKVDTSNFSPKISLDFRPADDLLIYGSLSKGFKSGTFNIVAITNPPDYVKPEEVTSAELGIKSSWLDGALRFNGAVFDTRIDDLQVQVISLANSGTVAFETAGQARIRGAEFDLLWELFPASLPGLVLTAAGTALDAKYTDFQRGSGYDEDTGLFFGNRNGNPRDFTGNRVTQAPEFSGNLGLSYSVDVPGGSVEIAGDGYYNSGMFYSAQNSPHSELDSYVMANARASYFHEDWGLRLTVFGRNLNNARTYLFNYETDFGTSALLQPDATYGLRLNWDFGG